MHGKETGDGRDVFHFSTMEISDVPFVPSCSSCCHHVALNLTEPTLLSTLLK